jgi:hypothetical protein
MKENRVYLMQFLRGEKTFSSKLSFMRSQCDFHVEETLLKCPGPAIGIKF